MQYLHSHWPIIVGTFSYSHAFCEGVPDNATPYDLVVVGGGIVGLATAREAALRHPNMRIALVEKEKQLGM